MNDNIIKRDYKIEITFDINDLPYWSLYRKGIRIVANDEQKQMVHEAFSELKEKLDNRITYQSKKFTSQKNVI